MEFWNELITEKSLRILTELSKSDLDFILIGGWAVYLFTKGSKSKDIDIVVDFNNLEKIKLGYSLKKNDHLKKFEIIIDEIDIDIYVPHYSALPIPAEEIANYTTKIEGFTVAKLEVLLILKQGAELDRKDSAKGLKDRIDILNLMLQCDINFALYRELIARFGLDKYKARLKEIIMTFNEIKYIGLNPREFKLKKKEIMQKI